MRYAILLLLLCLSACGGSSSPDSAKKEDNPVTVSPKEGAVNISWTAPLTYTDQTKLERLGGYKLYISKNRNEVASKTALPIILSPETLNTRVEELDLDVYYFGITAIDINNVEGEMSEIIERRVAANAPTQFMSCSISDTSGTSAMNCI